jgi:hypothetical protein
MLYELRTYEANPGKGPALESHIKEAGRLFKKHDLNAPVFWTDIIGRGPQVTYMWKYEDMTERNTKLGSFVSDQEWKDLTDRERAEHGEITARIHNKMLTPTAYSPEPVFDFSKVHELRIYHAVPGKLADLNRRFQDNSDRILRRHGMNVLGYWTEAFGTSNQLVWVIEFDSLAHREECWNSFRTDEEWPGVSAESTKNGELVAYPESRMLAPLRF